MKWSVEYTNEFGAWWAELAEREQDDTTAVVELLMELGPQLPFPRSSGIEGSRATVICMSFGYRAAAGQFVSSTPSTPAERQFF